MNKSVPYKLYSSVTETEVEWLWYPYIPYGKLTLLQGDPGDGKSSFVVSLAACLTTGGKLPDGFSIDKPQTVVYQCAEDSTSDTIKPRLISAGADCNKIAFIDDDDGIVTIDDQRIEETIRHFEARLLVLDPLQAFIPQEGDMQSAAKMRAILRKLARIAEQYRCAVILVGHMNKSTGGKKLYRSLGSIDIAAIARSVLMISRDTEEPQIRYMYPVKSSLAPEGDAIAFYMDRQVGFKWIGPCALSKATKDLESTSVNKKERAKELLNIMLSAKDLAATEIFSAMSQMNISERTVRAACKELEVLSYRKDDRWFWHLDSDYAEENQETE